MKKIPAPMFGGKATFEDKLAAIKAVIRDHDRRIEAAQAIGRRYLDDGQNLSPAGASLLRLTESLLSAKGMNPTSIADRVAAVGELQKLHMTDDVSPADLKRIVAHGATQPYTAPSAPASGDALVMKADDGTILVGNDREEALRLGGPTKGGERWSRLRRLAEKNGLNLSKPSDRRMGESWLFGEVAHPFPHGWKSLDEGVFVLQKREKLSLADATRRVRELAPHLVDEPYGRKRACSGDLKTFAQGPSAESQLESEVRRLASLRGLNANHPQSRAVLMKEALAADPSLGRRLYYGDDLDPSEDDDTPRRSTVIALAEHEEMSVRFERLVEDELRGQDLPRTYENRSRAAASVRRRHPELVPQYGSGRRRS